MLNSNSAPFLLALIISALGWYVGQLNSDIRNTRVAVYSVEQGEQPNAATAMVENVSQTTSLNRFKFVLKCDGRIDPRQTPQNQGHVVDRPPTSAIDPLLETRLTGEASVTTSLAPGGAVGLYASLADCDSAPQFYYQPNPAEPFLMLEAGSLQGWTAKHYANVLLIVFFVLSAVFTVWVAAALTLWWRKRNDKDSSTENVHFVRLSVLPADGPAAGPADDVDENRGHGKGSRGRNGNIQRRGSGVGTESG